jgi:hypothetical protein
MKTIFIGLFIATIISFSFSCKKETTTTQTKQTNQYGTVCFRNDIDTTIIVSINDTVRYYMHSNFVVCDTLVANRTYKFDILIPSGIVPAFHSENSILPNQSYMIIVGY